MTPLEQFKRNRKEEELAEADGGIFSGRLVHAKPAIVMITSDRRKRRKAERVKAARGIQ